MKCLLSLIGLSAGVVIANQRTAMETDSLTSRHHRHKHHHKVHNGPNSPQNTRGLEPGVSDTDFFGPPHKKDYVTDEAPQAIEEHRMDHPYPAIKSSDDEDRDYIEDSNGDGGAWEAQMKYDTLRAKLHKSKGNVARATSALESEQVKLDHAQEEENRREEARKKGEEEWRVKEEEKNRLEARVKGKLESVSVAEAEVELRTQELQQTERELQEATARLQEAQKELSDAEDGVQGLDAARKAADDAKVVYDESRKAEEKAENEVEKHMVKHDEAGRMLRKNKDDVVRTKAEANYARLRLGDHPRGDMDRTGDVGGIYKSDTHSTSLVAISWLFVLCY
eukprot:GEMP01072628.1.p1 GENE.GEMP01072628.1~~GEMP01072628.1.p1  ORF type:complete len:337 (+),score=116.80 GEMP01072628.1:58-1068(+)